MRSFANFTDIRPGEGVPVAKAVTILFCMIAAHTIMETARDSLFLGELPTRHLALVYGVLAILAVVASRLSARVLRRFGRRTGLSLTLVAAAYGAFLFFLVPKTETTVFCLYVYSGLVGSVAVVQFWMLATHWYTVAQGRRLFAPISAGGVLGAVAGASLAILALKVLPLDWLLLLGVAFYLAAAAVVTTVDSPEEPIREREKRDVGGLWRAARLFREHPYLVLLAVLLGISTAALLITDYLFKSVADANFQAERLAEFFAVYYAILNGFALLVQLTLSGYLVRRFGVLTGFLVLPALLLGGGVAIALLGGVLLVVLATKAADGGLRHSLHRVTSELLWMPLPDHVRTESKAFIDTVVVRAAQALTALTLLLLSSLGWDDARTLAVVLCGLLILWVAIGAGLRKPYIALFRTALSVRRQEQHYELDLDTVELVVEALSSRDAKRVVAAMELLASNHRSRLIPALVLYHESPKVLLAALPILSTPHRQDWVPLAERLLGHESVEVRIAAMEALVRAGAPQAAEERLYDIRPEVRGHASVLVERRHGGEDPRDHPAIRQLLALSGQAGAMARLGLLQSVRDIADPRYAELLLELAVDENDEVAHAATEAMTRIIDERFIPVLIERLAIRDGREAVRSAIVAHGNVALEQLRRRLLDAGTDPRVRRHIPGAISHFGTQRAADILASALDSEKVGLVRYKLLKALGRLIASHPVRVPRPLIEAQLVVALTEHLRMGAFELALGSEEPRTTSGEAIVSKARAMLLELLHDKKTQALERAFRLLQIAHPNEEIQNLEAATHSRDKRVRAQALEYVDTLTLDSGSEKVRTLFDIVVDDLSWTARVQRAEEHLDSLVKTSQQAITQLVQEQDETVSALAAYHLLELDRTLRPVGSDPEHPTTDSTLFDRELVRSLVKQIGNAHVQ